MILLPTRRSQILYLVDESRSSNPFAETLDMQGLQLVHKSVNDLTGSIHDLLEYNAIILDNEPDPLILVVSYHLCYAFLFSSSFLCVEIKRENKAR